MSLPTAIHARPKLPKCQATGGSGGGSSGGSGGGGGDGGKGDGKGDGDSGAKPTPAFGFAALMKGWEERVAYDQEFPVKMFLEQVLAAPDSQSNADSQSLKISPQICSIHLGTHGPR